VVGKVRAEQQALDLAQLQPYLTDQEKEILRRGRNAVTGKRRRLTAASLSAGQQFRNPVRLSLSPRPLKITSTIRKTRIIALRDDSRLYS
jgi:hypothetical protein